MTNAKADAPVAVLSVRCEEKTYPPYDHLHGTPDPMFQRRVTIETSRGKAVFEQSDYGHPGKLNPWDPRGIDSPLLPKLAQLRGICDAVTNLLA